MSKLPRKCRGKDLIKVLEKVGYSFSNVQGSHYVMVKTDCSPIDIITVPMHHSLKLGTLSKIIKKAGLSRSEFHKLYKK